MYVCPPRRTGLYLIDNFQLHKPVLIAVLISGLFSNTVFAADYQYDKDSQDSLTFFENSQAKDKYHTFAVNSALSEKTFLMNLSGFQPKTGRLSSMHFFRHDDALLLGNNFAVNLIDSSSDTSIYGISAEGVDRFHAKNNVMEVNGNLEKNAETSTAQHIHLIDLSYTKSTYVCDDNGSCKPSPVYGNNIAVISSNHLSIKNLFAGDVVTVSATHTGGTIDSNTLKIQNSQISLAKGISASSQTQSGSTLEAVNVTNNSVEAYNSEFNEIYGVQVSGSASKPIYGTVSGNTLKLSDVTMRKFGDKASFVYVFAQDVTGGNSWNIGDYPTVSSGELTITGNFNVIDGGSSQIGATRASVLNVGSNKLIFQNATVNFQSSSGAQIYGAKSSFADASDNSVEILSSKLTVDRASIIGGRADDGSALRNKVVIKDSTVSASSIVGAYSEKEVSQASVEIDSSTVSGEVAVFDGKAATNGSGSITVRGNSNLSQASLLPYTQADYKGKSDTTLHVDSYTGSIQNLGYLASSSSYKSSAFDHVFMTNQVWDTSKAIITVENDAVFRKSSLTDTSLSFTSADSISKGGTLTLISGDMTYLDPEEANERDLKSTAGTGLEFNGKVNFADDGISYTVKKIDAADQTVLVGDSRLAGAAFVNQGSDLLERVFHGFTLSRDKYGLMTFATAEGTKSDYDLSSPIKINSWNFLGGVRHITPTNYGDLTSALFVEYGDGNYRAENSHMGFDFRTDGSMKYIGGGFAMRIITPSNLYAEGSVRAGELRSDLERALMDNNGSFYDADTKSLYAGLHLGVGYIYNPANNFELDSYAKYFFTYTNSDSFRIAKYNETYEFESIDSHRLRLGTRLSTKKDNVTFMLGLAGEYEFAAESNMVVANVATQNSDLGGFSAFAEAGLSLRLTMESPWQFDVKVRGWEGARDAVTGMVTVNRLF